MTARTVCRAFAVLMTASLLLLSAAPDTALGKGGRSGGGGFRSSSSGRSSYSAPKSSSTPKSSYSAPKSSTPKSYSSGSSNYSSGSSSTAKPKPASTSGFGSGVTTAQAKAASAKAYQAKISSSQPKTTYASASGKSVKIDTPVEKQTQSTVRNYVTHERYVTYDSRANQVYGGYQQSSFNDYFSPFLMAYLLSSSLNSHDRAAWAYHHSDEIDDQRMKELLEKDAKLQAELDALKAANVAKDPNYVPPGLDKDLMYDKGFVAASLGVDKDFDPDKVAAAELANEESSGWSLTSLFLLLSVVGVVVVAGVYFVFIKEYPSA